MRSTEGMEVRRRRILWRACHRGTREMDLVFGGFMRAHIDRFNEAEINEAEVLVELSDDVLASWLLAREPVPDNYRSPLIARLLAYKLHPSDYS